MQNITDKIKEFDEEKNTLQEMHNVESIIVEILEPLLQNLNADHTHESYKNSAKIKSIHGDYRKKIGHAKNLLQTTKKTIKFTQNREEKLIKDYNKMKIAKEAKESSY